MPQTLHFALAVLAVWRITHLLSRENGPWNMFLRMRARPPDSMPKRLLSCFYCLSVWVALPFGWFVGTTLPEHLTAWWGISGAAVLLERATADPIEIEIRDGHSELLHKGHSTPDDQSG
jgi:hypothetical protein